MADLDGNFSSGRLGPGHLQCRWAVHWIPSPRPRSGHHSVTTFKSFNSTSFPETFVIEQAAEVVAKVDRAQGHLHGEHQEKVCRQHRLHLQSANQTHRRQRCRQRHEARVGRIYSRQLRLCSRTVGPVSENHVEWRRGAIHEPAQEHHRNGPLPHQLGGQPEGGQNPNRQPCPRIGRGLHLCRDQGLSGPVHVQLLQQLGWNTNTTGKEVLLQPTRQQGLARIRRRLSEASVPWPPLRPEWLAQHRFLSL